MAAVVCIQNLSSTCSVSIKVLNHLILGENIMLVILISYFYNILIETICIHSCTVAYSVFFFTHNRSKLYLTRNCVLLEKTKLIVCMLLKVFKSQSGGWNYGGF